MEPGLQKVEVYRIAHDLAVRIHAMSLNLPTFERFEEAPQVRRSSKRVSASIVEGYAQRKYKALYLSYLYRALGSSDETQEHLLLLKDTGSLADRAVHEELATKSAELSRKLFRFIQGVEQFHEVPNYLSDVPLEAFEPPPEDDEPLG
jgi:four helix bundle protein